MNVLFVVGATTEPHQIECILRSLAAGGHQVHLLVDGADAETQAHLEQRCHDLPLVRISPAPIIRLSAWSYLGGELLRALAHVQDSTQNRPELIARVLRSGLFMSVRGRRLLSRGLRWTEGAVPSEPAADALLQSEAPDALLVMPPTAAGAPQVDVLRSARQLGVPAFVLDRADGDGVATLIAGLDTHAAGAAHTRRRSPWGAGLARPLLRRVALRLAATDAARQIKLARQEQARHRRTADISTRRARLLEAKRTATDARERRKRDQAAHRDALRAADETAAARAYELFQRVRDWAGRAGQIDRRAIALTDSERRMLAGLAPLSSAGRDAIATLRHWGEPITGVRASDYDTLPDELNLRLRREFYVLRKEIGPALMVSEPSGLGGFGVVRAGVRYNEDTLQYFHAIGAMHDAAVLTSFRDSATRRVVWEIGGGWGGFAYQFKTLCPNVTYLITGLPDVLLVSAVYLGSVFPNARCRFYGESGADTDLWQDWESIDFVFAPESALADLRPPRLDLTVDVAALRQATPSRISAHVQHAFDWDSRYFYSMLPAATAADEAPVVWSAIERRYWPHPVPPRAVGAIARKRPDAPQVRFAHLAGWKRMRV